MRKYFLIGTIMLISLTGCIPSMIILSNFDNKELELDMPHDVHQGCWYLKNTTDIPLKFSYKKENLWRTPNSLFKPGDSISFYVYNANAELNEFPSHQDLLRDIDSIYVYGEDGTELCKWIKKESKEESVFNEGNWAFWDLNYVPNDHSLVKDIHIRVYEISSEELELQ